MAQLQDSLAKVINEAGVRTRQEVSVHRMVSTLLFLALVHLSAHGNCATGQSLSQKTKLKQKTKQKKER